MNYHEENRNALVPPANRLTPRADQVPAPYQAPQGGYPAGYPAAYARYPALEIEKNSLREYWRVIKRHKWAILSTLLIVTSIVTVATYLTRPVFRATTKVEIGKETERVVSGQRIMEVETANVFNPLYLQTQVEILQSRDLARRVIQKLRLSNHDEFQLRAQTPLGENEREVQLVNKFQSRYDVASGRMSRVVSLSFDAYNPQLAAEVENLVDERLAQQRGGAVDQVPAQVGLPVGNADRSDHAVQRLEELRLTDVDRPAVGNAHAVEHLGPRDRGGDGSERVERHLVVVGLGVAALDPGERGIGELGLDGQHRLGVLGRGRRVVADQREHLGHVRHVLVAQLLRGVVGLGVVVAVRQTQAPLTHVDDHVGAVLGVLRGEQAERNTHALGLEPGDRGLQVIGGLDRGDSPQL